jgi:hypothetical protein
MGRWIRKLSRHGGATSVRIPVEICRRLAITPRMYVNIDLDELGRIRVWPLEAPTDDRVARDRPPAHPR